MKKTKYYVFDCDTDLYNVSQKINIIFNEIQKESNGNIYVRYGYSETVVDEKCSCNLFPDDTISLVFGRCDITFHARGKVLKLDVDTFKTFDDVDYYIKVKIINKG